MFYGFLDDYLCYSRCRILTLNGREDTLNRPPHQQIINYNCIDPLGRSAVLIAIDNENYEMLKLLINNNVDTTDALLHAVSKEFVEAVELLINYEENKRKLGEIHVRTMNSKNLSTLQVFRIIFRIFRII